MIILDGQKRNLKDSQGRDILDSRHQPKDRAIVVGLPKPDQFLAPGVYRQRKIR